MSKQIAVCFVLLGSLTCGCGYDEAWVVANASPHVIPTWRCEGDPEPMSAAWTNPDIGRAKIKIYTSETTGSELLCEAGVRLQWCGFARPVTQADQPLKVAIFQRGEERFSTNISYEVLSGPRDTKDFTGQLEIIEPKVPTRYVKMTTPVYGRCDPSPSGDEPNREKVCKPVCVDKVDGNGNPERDASGNIIQDCSQEECTCPDEGRVIGVTTRDVAVQIADKEAIVWNVADTWFSPRVETRSYRYKAGELALSLSGPGMNGSQTLRPGEGGTGNDMHPSGAWLGQVSAGQQVTTSTDVEGDVYAVQNHSLQFSVACADE